MKGKLFCVFMPFQLLVAQQIIRHEKLEKCTLVEGYRKSFGAIYDLIYIDSLWSQRIHFEKLALFTREDLSFWKGNVEAWKNFQWFKALLHHNDVDTIYLGEAKNQGYRFITKVFSGQNYKIAYFEEGTSHYSYIPFPKDNRLITFMKTLVMDTLYYIPLYHTTFATWRYNTKKSYEELPIYRRYSIISNYFNKPYDVVLPVEPMFSPQMEKYLCATMEKFSQDKLVLFMTDPVDEYLGENWERIYKRTLYQAFESIREERTILLKFHPRDSEKGRDLIKNVLTNMGMRYEILAPKVNIPVEYYLQKFHFDDIYLINASTYFYNGILYPQTKFDFLLPLIYQNALTIGIHDAGRIWIERILALQNELKRSCS